MAGEEPATPLLEATAAPQRSSTTPHQGAVILGARQAANVRWCWPRTTFYEEAETDGLAPELAIAAMR